MGKKKRYVAATLASLVGLTGVSSVYAASPNGTKTSEVNGEQRIIVVYKDKSKVDPTKITGANGKVHHISKNSAILSATVSTSEVDKLRKDPDVLAVEPDIIVHTQAQTTDWGITDVKAPSAWGIGNTGAGVKVAVVDTGIAPHDDLLVAGGTSVVNYTTSYADDNGHGTHVGGIIGAENNSIGTVGVAPDADVYAVKALNSKGSGYLSDIIAGIDWAISNNMNIVNLSLGTTTDSLALQQEVDKAYSSGILVVAAAGNDGGAVNYPAKYSSAIAVSAVDSTNTIATFSSRGPEVEVAAPGVSILSTYLNNQYATMSGTSMATPMVAGELALIKQANPTASASTLRNTLAAQVLDLGAAGRDDLYGFGLIQSVGTISNTPTAPVTLATSTSVITDKTSYKVGSTATITATVTDQNGIALSGATVNLTITTPTGAKITGAGTTTSTGKVVFKYSTTKRSAKGTYNVKVDTTLINYTSSSVTTSFTLN